METIPSLVPRPSPSKTTGTSSRQQDKKYSKKTILAWLTACKAIVDGDLVQYSDGKNLITGRICNGCIICNCCNEEVSKWKFELHAQSEYKQPYKHILVLGEQSIYLLQNRLISVWDHAEEQKRAMFTYVPEHDVACLVCGGRQGEFINCNNCPSTYHRSCAYIQGVPCYDNYWLCPYCKCKCGGGEETNPLILCHQCNKKFHWRCVKDSESDLLRIHCSISCKQIDEKLKGLFGVQNNINGNESCYSWRVLQQMDKESEDLYVISNSKVAVACMLMDEAFGMITEAHAGVNVVQIVIYNRRSNRRLDFR